MAHWDQEKAIKEKRTIEATKKNLIGNAGKLGFICKILGHPITRQGSAYMDASFLDDPYDTQQYDAEYASTMGEDNLGPMIDSGHMLEYEGDFVYEEGQCFDGLHWGMHIEIINNFAEKKITTTYKGYKVYEEIAGDLICYAPFDDWEQMVDRLYKVARDRAKKDEPLRLAELELKIVGKKKNFMQRLRERWGL